MTKEQKKIKELEELVGVLRKRLESRNDYIERLTERINRICEIAKGE